MSDPRNAAHGKKGLTALLDAYKAECDRLQGAQA